jgi:AcrR family transcriptional regulator
MEKSGYHHGDLGAALIAKARELVAVQGAEQVSMREVAAKVGVSPSAVYHHFPDRDSLLAEVGKVIFDEIAASQILAMKPFLGSSVIAIRKRFRALGLAYFEYAQSNPNLFRLCFGPLCQTDHESGKTSNQAWQMLVAGLDEMASVGLIAAGIRPDIEILVWSAIHGYSMLVLDGLLPAEAIIVLLDSLEEVLLGISKDKPDKLKKGKKQL